MKLVCRNYPFSLGSFLTELIDLDVFELHHEETCSNSVRNGTLVSRHTGPFFVIYPVVPTELHVDKHEDRKLDVSKL